jgi:drug/metabolite transporter (DMT)-like permease
MALALLATLCFALLDTVSQYVSKLVPVLLGIWFRYVVQTGLTGALLWPQYRSSLLRSHHHRWQLGRGLLMVASSTVAFMSLRFIPVGEFTAIMMLVPLVMTLMAAWMLGERVHPWTWVLVAGGLTGALVVIRPHGSDFHAGMLLPLLLVVINAVYQIVTSRMMRTEDPGVTHFYTGLVGLVCASLALPWAWDNALLALPWTVWGALALLGVFGSLGHYLLIHAYKKAPASRLTPLMYAQIGFATLTGWAAFGHAPDRWSLLGIALIALCGLLATRLKTS